MLRDWHDEEVVAIGWPWHGRVVTLGGIHTLELPGGGSMPLPRFSHADRVTWTFDMGLPDTPDPVVEDLGGAWWGRAIMRDGRFWSGLRPDGSGGMTGVEQIVPLWWEEDETPAAQFVLYAFFSDPFRLSWRNAAGALQTVTPAWSYADIGQGNDQPLCAARSSTATAWRLVGQADDYACPWFFLGAHKNKMLFGLVLRAFGGTGLPHPPATAPGSSSPGGAPSGYCGLVEVSVDKALFGPGGDPAVHLHLTVLEDRQTALGNPTYTLSDVTAPGGGSRNRVEETEQASALLTAWYDNDGAVRSVRYNRWQEARFDYLGPAVDDRHWDVSRTTQIELLYAGAVIDQRTLAETLDVDYVGTTLTIERKITESGVADDVASWAGFAASLGTTPEPLPVFRAGQGLVMGVVAYIFNVTGLGNVLREQDVRQIWLVAHSNNVASLCRSREPFDYPDGGDVMQVEAYSGPAIGPAGIVPGSMNRVLDRARTVIGPFYRGFFSAVGQRWVLGTGNPVTGQIVRADDYYGWPDGYPQISWV